MSVTDSQLENFATFVLNHEALPVILERMSIRYWGEFREGDLEQRVKVSAKQDNMDAFFSELQIILNNEMEKQTE